tara:strand:+ start:4560 stop:4997 length:438 start_codon:yes stop_codon:yes gene_type:complete
VLKLRGVLRGDLLSAKRKVNVDGEEFEVTLAKEGQFWKVEVEGQIFSIEVEGGDSDISSTRKRKGSRKTRKSGVVSSSIPGKIVSLSINAGDIVAEGDVIMILEAMKMQNEIQAPISGEIIELNCRTGDSIEANSPLLVIEPPSD